MLYGSKLYNNYGTYLQDKIFWIYILAHKGKWTQKDHDTNAVSKQMDKWITY